MREWRSVITQFAMHHDWITELTWKQITCSLASTGTGPAEGHDHQPSCSWMMPLTRVWVYVPSSWSVGGPLCILRILSSCMESIIRKKMVSRTHDESDTLWLQRGYRTIWLRWASLDTIPVDLADLLQSGWSTAIRQRARSPPQSMPGFWTFVWTYMARDALSFPSLLWGGAGLRCRCGVFYICKLISFVLIICVLKLGKRKPMSKCSHVNRDIYGRLRDGLHVAESLAWDVWIEMSWWIV